MMAAGTTFGSRTTFAIRLFFHRSYWLVWHTRHSAEPTYAGACARAFAAASTSTRHASMESFMGDLSVFDEQLRELLLERVDLRLVVDHDVGLQRILEGGIR